MGGEGRGKEALNILFTVTFAIQCQLFVYSHKRCDHCMWQYPWACVLKSPACTYFLCNAFIQCISVWSCLINTHTYIRRCIHTHAYIRTHTTHAHSDVEHTFSSSFSCSNFISVDCNSLVWTSNCSSWVSSSASNSRLLIWNSSNSSCVSCQLQQDRRQPQAF